MKKLIKKLPPKAVTAMLAASGLLMLSGTIGGTRAALTYYSDTYKSRMTIQNIGVTLVENDQEISWRNYDDKGDWQEGTGVLLSGMPKGEKDGDHLTIGKAYDEVLKVKNTGTIGEYVRVSVYKYWVDEEGNKVSAPGTENDKKDPEGEPVTQDDEGAQVDNEGGTPDQEGTEGSGDTPSGSEELGKPQLDVTRKNRTLDPGVIELELDNTDLWLKDEEASTDERIVLYYKNVLPVGEETKAFTRSLRIHEKIVNMVSEDVTKEGDVTTIKTTYDYDGKQFRIEVEVEAVQNHNAEDAILSAWGRNVTVVTVDDDDEIGYILSLNKMESFDIDETEGAQNKPVDPQNN